MRVENSTVNAKRALHDSRGTALAPGETIHIEVNLKMSSSYVKKSNFKRTALIRSA